MSTPPRRTSTPSPSDMEEVRKRRSPGLVRYVFVDDPAAGAVWGGDRGYALFVFWIGDGVAFPPPPPPPPPQLPPPPARPPPTIISLNL